MKATTPTDRTALGPADLLSAAADGDEAAFVHLMDAYDGQLRRLAVAMLGDATGEQLMPEMWCTALKGWSADMVADAEAVRAWLCTIVMELARARGVAVDARSKACPRVAPDRFLPVGHRWAGHWAVAPAPWEAEMSSPDAAAAVRLALSTLPSVAARAATILRDVDGFPGPVVAQILGIDEAEERGLLHAGRTAAREALERLLAST